MRKQSDIAKSLSMISQIGLLMAIPVVGGIIFGNFLDEVLHTKVLFLIIFTLLGAAAAFRNLFVYTAKLVQKEKKDEERKSHGDR